MKERGIYKIFYIFLLSLIVIGIFFRLYSLKKDFIGEETVFVAGAEAVRDTGLPIFYHSEREKHSLALWHPPMYVYALYLLMKIGDNEILLRSINAIASILTTFLIFLFCFYFLDKDKRIIVGLISSAFFLINFYFLSSSMIIDIDIFSMLFLFSFIFFIIASLRFQKKSFLFLGSLTFFLSLWNRFPIAVITYLAMGIYFFCNQSMKSFRYKYFLIGFTAVACFLVTWFAYSTFIVPGTFFYFISHNLEKGSEQLSSLKIYSGSFLINIVQFIRLFTFPGFLLMIFSFVYFLKNKSYIHRILIIFSASILFTFSYTVLTVR